MQPLLRQACRSRAHFFPLRQTPRNTFPSSYRTLIITRFTKEHESIAFDDSTGIGLVSITEHAQESLGDVVFVELPKVGQSFKQGEQIGAVESVKAASDIYAPASGTVVEVNEALEDKPGLVNKSAEVEGWICKMKLTTPSEVEGLMTKEVYKASYEK